MKFKTEGPGSGYGRFNVSPVSVGKRYEVEVEEMTEEGDGIARVQGFVIFVKGGKPGHKIKGNIKSVGARFATGEPVQEQQ